MSKSSTGRFLVSAKTIGMSRKDLTLFGALTAAFLLIKFLTPSLLFHAGLAQALVRQLPPAGMSPEQFYLGHLEVYVGMVTQVFSGLVFAAFCLRHLANVPLKTFGLAVFAYFLVTKCEVLFYPPYGDPISGPWVEAVWLARHNFDFAGLAQQPGYLMGGAKVYLFSIYPAFLAFLMKVFPVKISLLVNHLLTFAMAAASVAIIRGIGDKYLPKQVSILTAVLIVALPLFQSMTEGINMEIPSLFFVMLTVRALVRRSFGMATLWALLGVLVKGYGMIACSTVFIVALIDGVLSGAPIRARLKNIAWGTLALGWTFMQVFLKYLIRDQHTINDMGFLRGFLPVVNSHIFKIFAVSIGSCLLALVLRWRRRGPWEFVKALWAKYDAALIVFIAAFNWVLLFINFAGHSPRYDIIMCVLLPFIAVFSVGLLIKNAGPLVWLLWPTLAVTLFVSYGIFIPDHSKETSYYQYLVLERTLEYRSDLKMYMNVAQELEKNFGDFTVGAPFIFVQVLALPELGYVRKPIKAMSYGTPVVYEGITQFNGLENLDITKTVWIGLNGHLSEAVRELVKDFPIDPQRDLVLKQVGYGERHAALFMGGASIHACHKIMQYLQQQKALRSLR